MNRCALVAFAAATLGLGLGCPGASDADGANAETPLASAPISFRLETIDVPPLASVAVWRPASKDTPAEHLVVLLHGNQGSIDNPNWLVDLRYQLEFSQSILLVPTLPQGDYHWERPSNLSALRELVERTADEYAVRGRTIILGYSAGGSRVLQVANELDGAPLLVSVAGDIARPFRSGFSAPSLHASPTLLVCMSEDNGPHASCELDERNASQLRSNGFASIATRRHSGNHSFRMAILAPLIQQWIASQGASPQQRH